RHSAGGNPIAQRRAGAAVGLRNLQPSDALESVKLRASAAARAQRLQGAGGWAWPGWIHAVALPDERRPHRGRNRWTEDRASARRDRRRRRTRRALAI